MIYEYRCDGCGAAVTGPYTTPPATHPFGQDWVGPGLTIDTAPCGPLRRVWGFSIAWPADQRGH